MKVEYRIIGSNNTPVTEATIRREANERATEKGRTIEWDCTGTRPAIELRTPKPLVEQGMPKQEAFAVCRQDNADALYIFPQHLFVVCGTKKE